MSIAKEILHLLREDYNVPEDLFFRYLNTIKSMELARGISLSYYSTLEQEREKIHNEICKSVGVTRDDHKFSVWLAQEVEKTLGNF